MPVYKQDVRIQLLMMGTGDNPERRKVGRAKKLRVQCQGADGLAERIVPEGVQFNMFRDEERCWRVKEVGVPRMAIVITALRLAGAHLRQLRVLIHRLV